MQGGLALWSSSLYAMKLPFGDVSVSYSSSCFMADLGTYNQSETRGEEGRERRKQEIDKGEMRLEKEFAPLPTSCVGGSRKRSAARRRTRTPR